MSELRAAVVQAAPVGFDREATLDKVEALVAEAAGAGAELVLFPEAFVSAYPWGLDFGAKIGSRTPEGREMFRRYFESAVDVPGPDTERLGELCRAKGLDLVLGIIERDGGTLYCTILYVGRDGRLLGKHRKLVPTACERLVWGRGDGSTLTVVDTDKAKVGAAICWENYMPLFRTALYAKGVQVYCTPTVEDRDVWQSTVRHIAVEGRCFVLNSVQQTRRRDYPDDYPTDLDDNPDAVMIRGGSCIVDPFGEVLAGPVYEEEVVLTATLDLDQIPRAKYDLDSTGHYSRPDIFQLRVDERPQGIVFEDQSLE
jgi:nitrilase